MTPFVHEYYVNLRTGAAYERAKKPLSQGNALADKIVVHVQDCGSDVDLTGMGVSALVVRFDGQTVPLTGSIEDGTACITLDKDSYAVPGEARVTVMLSAGEMVQTVLVLLVNVDTSQTSVVVENGTIGDLTELLSAVADMRTATADALAAAETANGAADDNAAKTEAAIVEMRAEAGAAIADVHATLGNALAGVSEVLADVAPGIEITESGALVTVRDAAERHAVQVVSAIEEVQSGTGDPSPSNVRPIIGWDAVGLTRTQKNMFSFEAFSITASSGTFTDTYADGVFTRAVSVGVDTSYAVATSAMQYLKHSNIPAGTYTFTATYTGNTTYRNMYLEITLADGTIAKLQDGVTTTIEQGGTITAVRMPSQRLTAGTVIECTMQLEAGTGTGYEPYSGATMTAALPETVYGGSLDWTTGVLTVTHISQTLDGTEAWSGSDGVYKVDNRAVQERAMVDNNFAYHLCSHYKPVKYSADQADLTCYTLNNTELRIKDTARGTLDDFKAFLAGTPVTLLWPLKPAYYTTIQLTPQQLDMIKGHNTVWSDSGDTSLVYVADTKLYIDNAIAAIAASIINA